MSLESRLDAHCRRTLEDIVSVSQQIRFSTLGYVNDGENHRRNVQAVESFRVQIGMVRRSAEAIHEAITLQNCNLDESLFAWVFSGELCKCLDQLKHMEGILSLDGQVLPRAAAQIPPQTLGLVEDNVTRVIAFFNQCKNTFRFLLDQKLWDNPEKPHQLSPAVENLQNTEETQDDVEESVMTSIAVIAHRQFIQQKLDEVLRWLAALNCTEKHIETLKLRRLGTCTWFPKTAAYNVWRTGKSKILWMYGQAGCGKSVVVASTLEHLNSTLAAGEALAYFYCDFRNERSTNATEVMRSLLSQLFRQLRAFRVDPGALPNWILEQKHNAGALLLHDLDRLASWVCHAASRFPHKPVIVIDALDECGNVKELLGALTMLIQADVRLLVTSRPEEIIEQYLGRYPSLSFREMDRELAADINMHISRELDSYVELRFVDADIKNEICTRLREKAEGRFRWIQCQLDTLKRCSSIQELQKVLDDLPGELGATYERILGKIDERRSEGKVARRALAWLVVALTPLRLVQLVEGLALDAQRQGIDCQTHTMGPALVQVLSSLVTYNKTTDVLTLSHHTVKEYLTSRTTLPAYQVIPYEAHIEVAQMCMFFITVLIKKVRFRANHALLESFPMIHYVFSGFDHLAHIDSGSMVTLDILQSFASDVQRHPSHWDLLCELREEDPRRHYPPWPSSRHDLVLYILVAYSTTSLLQSFLRSRPFEPRGGTNPLVYAADLCKTAHGLALLGSGADANELGLVVDDSRHALPLEVAVDQGNDILVSELLRKGSVIPSELIATAVCMPWCTVHVLVHLVNTDAFAEWACEIKDEDLYRGIFNSARPNAGDAAQTDKNYVVLARRLRDVGQNLSPNSSFGAELVERALHAAHPSMLEHLLPPGQSPPDQFLITACTGNTSETASVVRLLLRRGADVRAVSPGRRDTVLHLTAMCPWEPRALELTKILLGAGCKPTARNRRGETPLIVAMRRGYFTVVEHLLSRSNSIPSHILLHAVQRRVKPPIIRFLVYRGANIHIRTSSGNSVLHLILMDQWSANAETWNEEDCTVERTERAGQQDTQFSQDNEENEYHEGQCLELCKVFIEAGCNPTGSVEGRTILKLAISHGYDSIVEYLLLCDVPLPRDALPAALQRRLTPQIVELLLRKGADMNSRNGDGNTALHLAVTNFGESKCLNLVKIFIKAGFNLTSRGAEGRSVLELAINREYTLVVDYLLARGVPLPPDVLLSAAQTQGGLSCKVAEFLLRKGVDVNFKTVEGDTVLHLAVTRYLEPRCLDLVKIFIEAGCDPTSGGSQRRSVLKLAINRGYSSVVEYLLSCGVPVIPGNLPITTLQRRLTPQVVELLLRKGVDMNPSTGDGNTILHLAVTNFDESKCLDWVKIFIEAGWDPTSNSAEGKSVLKLAINRGYESAAEYLLSCGARLPPDILLAAAQGSFDCNMVEFLLRQGADVHSKTSEGDTVLHLAVTTGKYPEPQCLDLVKIFIEAGCDPTSRNAKDRSVLELAITANRGLGYKSVVEYLLSRGVPLPQDILLTVMQRNLSCKMARLLLRNGADVRSETDKGETVLHLAVTKCPERRSLELVKIFIEAGCNPTSSGAPGTTTILGLSIARTHASVVEYLLLRGFPVPFEVFPLARQQWLTPRLVELFIRNGVTQMPSTILAKDKVSKLRLRTFSMELEPMSQCLYLFRGLIEIGWNPHACNSETTKLLVATIERGCTSVAELLLSYSVPLPLDILDIALRLRSSPPMIEALVRHGANVHFIKSDGITLRQATRALYVEPDRRQIIKIIGAAQNGKRTYDNATLGDETTAHIAKRSRLARMS